jgi:hypothetical protein
LATVEITRVGFETLYLLEQYMGGYISNPEQLIEQLLVVMEEMLTEYPDAGPICPELECIGVTDYRQLSIENDYKILYRHDAQRGKVFVTAFMRTRQSAEKLLVQYALLK